MNYEQKYKAALEWMASLYDGLHGKTKEEAERFFPELKENREERIVKELLNMVLSVPDKKWHEYSISKEEAIEWFKKNYPRCTYKSTTVSTSDITTITTKTNENKL